MMVAAVTFATGIFYTREVKTTETAQTTSEKQTTEESAEETISAKKIGICIYRYDDDFMKLITKELKNSFIHFMLKKTWKNNRNRLKNSWSGGSVD